MRYSVFLKSPTEEYFLQSSTELFKVKKDRGTLNRWLNEMGIPTANLDANSGFLIYDNSGQPIYERRFAGAGANSWKLLGK